MKISVVFTAQFAQEGVCVPLVQQGGTARGFGQHFGVSEGSKRQGLAEKNIVLRSFIYCIYADMFYIQCLVLAKNLTKACYW